VMECYDDEGMPIGAKEDYETEIEISGLNYLVYVTVDWHHDEMACDSVWCEGDLLDDDIAQEFVMQHEELIWSEIEFKNDVHSRLNYEDHYTRRAESGWAQ